MTPIARIMPDGHRLHLQHGPSDLIVLAEGDRDDAYRAAAQRFATIIAEVMAEIGALRAMLSPSSARPDEAVARRMFDAAALMRGQGTLTPMAAVAGAIADEVLASMMQAGALSRAYVNNGGDIALYLAPGTRFATAICGHDGHEIGRIRITAHDNIRGIATSGRHGRSLSMGIADSVTVLAATAAQADAAATLVANAVDLPGHPAVIRRAASDVADDSDLGARPVVTGCARLPLSDCRAALAAGEACARDLQSRGLIKGAALHLQGQTRVTCHTHFNPARRELLHA